MGCGCKKNTTTVNLAPANKPKAVPSQFTKSSAPKQVPVPKPVQIAKQVPKHVPKPIPNNTIQRNQLLNTRVSNKKKFY